MIFKTNKNGITIGGKTVDEISEDFDKLSNYISEKASKISSNLSAVQDKINSKNTPSTWSYDELPNSNISNLNKENYSIADKIREQNEYNELLKNENSSIEAAIELSKRRAKNYDETLPKLTEINNEYEKQRQLELEDKYNSTIKERNNEYDKYLSNLNTEVEESKKVQDSIKNISPDTLEKLGYKQKGYLKEIREEQQQFSDALTRIDTASVESLLPKKEDVKGYYDELLAEQREFQSQLNAIETTPIDSLKRDQYSEILSEQADGQMALNLSATEYNDTLSTQNDLSNQRVLTLSEETDGQMALIMAENEGVSAKQKDIAETTSQIAAKEALVEASNKELLSNVNEKLAKTGVTSATEELTIAKLREIAASNEEGSALAKETLEMLGLGEASKVTSIALKGLAMVGNMIAAWAIAEVLQLVVKGLDELANSVDNCKERVDNLMSSYQTALDTANSNASRVEELASDYEKLSKGVNNLGENVSLTSEEYEQYNSLVSEIADMFPTLIQGYNDQGTAILNLKGNVEGLRDAYKEAQTEAYNTLIASGENGDGNDIIKQWEDVHDPGFFAGLFDLGSADVGGKISVSDALAQLEEIQKLTAEEYRNIENIAAVGSHKEIESLTDIQKEIGYGSYIGKALGIDGNVTDKEFEEAKKQAKVLVQTYNAEIESALSDVETLANAYLMTNDDYSKLTDSSKTAASLLVNNLTEDIASDFSSKEDVGSWVDSVVSKLQNNPTLSNAINGLFTTDLSNMSVDEAKAVVDQYINTIAKILEEDPVDVKVRLGFDDYNDDDIAPLKTKVQGFLKDEFDDKVGELSLDDLQVASKLEIPEGTLLSWDELKQKIEEAKNAIPNETPISKSGMIDEINALSDGFDILDKIYADIKDGDVFDFTNLDSSKFTEAFSGLEDEYTAFIEKVSASPNDLNGCQDAFDDLVSAWLESKGVLNDVTDDTAQLTISMLENMGVSNAEEIVTATLAQRHEEAAIAKTLEANSTSDLSNVTGDEITNLLNEGVITEDTAQKMAAFALKKQFINQNTVNTAADCENIIRLAEVAGAGTEALTKLEALKQRLADNPIMSNEMKSNITSQINTIVNGVYTSATKNITVPQLKYSGGNSSNKKSSSGSSSKSSKDELKEAFQAEYDLLKHNLEMEYITEEQYYNGVQALNEKYFAGKEEYLDEYRKYEEEVYKGLKSYYKSYCDDMMDYYDKKLDASKMSYKEYCDSVSKMLADMHNSGKISDKDWYDYTKTMLEKQKDAYDRALSAITRRLQKEIDAWQAKIDALNDQNDVLNDQKDNMDSAIDAITRVYDAEIDRIQGIIDGLKNANDERERTLALEQAKYELEKAYNQRVKKIYTEGKGYTYEVDYDAIKDAQKTYDDAELDVKTDELQKQIETLEEFKKKWQDVQNAYQQSIDDMNATALLGSEYQKLILNNNIIDIENFKTKYLAIQAKINDNEELIKSYEEKVDYYNKLKDQWSSLSDEYSNSVDDMYAKMLLGQSWETDVLNGRLSTLNDFRNQYNDIQKSISDMAWQSANAQISALNAVKAAEATKAQTSGGSNGYSGSSGSTTSVGSKPSSGSGLTAAQKYQVRLAGTVKVIYEGSSETDLRNWITRNNYIGVSRTIQGNVIIYFAKKKEKKYIGQVYKTSGQAASQVGMLGGVGYDKVSGGYQVYKYAKGTDNAKKGWHIVSEDNPELIVRNNGEIELAKGEQFYNFEGGEKVIPANETKEILKNQGNVESLSNSDVITRKDGSILKPIHYEYENMLANFIKDNPDYMYSMNTMSDNVCRDLFKNTENVNYDNRSVDNRVSIGEIHLHEVQNPDQFVKALDRQLVGIVDQKLSRRKR